MRSRVTSPGIERLFRDQRQYASPATRSLRIALIAHLKYPIAQPYSGGLEMHTHLVARKLSAHGHDVTLFAAFGSNACTKIVSVCDPTAGLTGEDEHYVEQGAYEQIVKQIAAGGFDVVHNNSLHFWPLLKQHSLPPMVTVLHTPPFPTLAGAARAAGNGCYIAVSHALAAQWRGIVAETNVVPNGVELEMFAPAGPRSTSPKAIWFGRIVPEKGLHLALDASKAAGLPLEIAGPIIDRTYWANEIAPRCDASVTYLGHLDHSTLRWHIARASVALVTPRWEEPFGLVAAEALATGTPVAAFRRGALPDVIGDAGCLATPDNPLDLARAARAALLIDPALCRQRAEDALDCRAMISRYETIYDRICQARAPFSTAAE